ncbi:MAG TPA: PIG-L family deacetylase, partial [Bacteroidales bacterium]|nr:PIG-L family deacetylase [Bacteroidales bacterium]
MRVSIKLIVTILVAMFCGQELIAQSSDGKLRIIVIGAHPDDPEKVGGTVHKWAQLGHDVLLVSLTSGNAGHQTYSRKQLAQIRREEARRAGEV